MRETKIEKYLVDCVEHLGGVCRKWVDTGRRGAPDRICILPGNRIFFVETKAPNGVLKSWQARYHKMLRDRGCYVRVLWSIEQVEEFYLAL